MVFVDGRKFSEFLLKGVNIVKLQNPYTRGYIEYPLYFEPEKLKYFIRHETPFSERFSEWLVAHIETGDVIYIPCEQNRCRNIYIVTRFYLDKTVQFPKGIYTLPLNYFTIPKNANIVTNNNNIDNDNDNDNNNDVDIDNDMFDDDDFFFGDDIYDEDDDV